MSILNILQVRIQIQMLYYSDYRGSLGVFFAPTYTKFYGKNYLILCAFYRNGIFIANVKNAVCPLVFEKGRARIIDLVEVE